jgi:hypothetical protein
MTARAISTRPVVRSIIRPAFFAAAILGLAACDQPAAPRNEPQPVTVSSVQLDGASWLVEQASAFYAVAVTGTDGRPMFDREVTWASSDVTVATVSGGVVYAIRPGEVMLTAAAGGKSASMRVVVRPLTVETVEVSPMQDVFAGESRLAGASLRAADGRLLERPVTWASLDPSIARVEVDGRVHGVSAGATYLVATSEGRSGSVRVVVKPSRASGRWSITGTALRNANTVCSISGFYLQVSQSGTALSGELFYDMWSGQGPTVTCTAIVGQPGPYTTPMTPAGAFTGSIADNGYAVLTSSNGWQLIGMLDRATGKWSGALHYAEGEATNGIVALRTGTFTATRI